MNSFLPHSTLRRKLASAVATLLFSGGAAAGAAAPPAVRPTAALNSTAVLRSVDDLISPTASATGGHPISWTLRLKSIAALLAPLQQGRAIGNRFKTLRLAQGDIAFRQWLRLQPPRRQAIFRAGPPSAKLLRIASMAFSPGAGDRSAAARHMAAIPAPAADLLLDALLTDPSRRVRLQAVKELTGIQPDRRGFSELIWLAVRGAKAGRLQFNPVRRTWRSLTYQPSFAPVDPLDQAIHVTVHRVRCGQATHSITDTGIVRRFGRSDGRAAALAIAAWHSTAKRAALQCLVPQLLRRVGRPDSNYTLQFMAWPAAAWRLVDAANLIRLAGPQTLGPILLRILASPDARRGRIIAPQGRAYYHSGHTFPLVMAFLELHENPTAGGIVRIGRRNYEGLHVPWLWCALSRARQRRAITAVQAQFAAMHIFAGPKTRPAAAAVNPLLSGGAVRGRISLGMLEIGIVGWLRWTSHLRSPHRTAMLTWGRTGANVNQAALAFSGSAVAQMDAARFLAGERSYAAARILIHLLKSDRPAVQLTAVNMLRWQLTNPPDARALETFAFERSAAGQSRPAAKPWSIRMTGKRFTFQPRAHRRRESGRQAFLIRRQAIIILQNLPQKAGAALVVGAADQLRTAGTGPLAVNLLPRFRRQYAARTLQLARRFVTPLCVPALLADICAAHQRRIAGRHFDQRIIPLLLLCQLAHRSPLQFGLDRLPGQSTAATIRWCAAGRQKINAGIQRMKAFWAARHVTPAADPKLAPRHPA